MAIQVHNKKNNGHELLLEVRPIKEKTFDAVLGMMRISNDQPHRSKCQNKGHRDMKFNRNVV